jgi:hypothetical protein
MVAWLQVQVLHGKRLVTQLQRLVQEGNSAYLISNSTSWPLVVNRSAGGKICYAAA